MPLAGLDGGTDRNCAEGVSIRDGFEVPRPTINTRFAEARRKRHFDASRRRIEAKSHGQQGKPGSSGAWNRSNGEGPPEGQEAPEGARSAGSRSQAVQPDPVPPDLASGAEARTETAAAAPMVLVVEDYADAREMYAEFLRFMGFRVAEARNGEEALARAVEFTPDVVLMDLGSPPHGRMGGDPTPAQRPPHVAGHHRRADRACARRPCRRRSARRL